MIYDGIWEENEAHFVGLHVIPVLLLVATSIDALAVGVSLGVLGSRYRRL